jgi:hypothetical protein
MGKKAKKAKAEMAPKGVQRLSDLTRLFDRDRRLGAILHEIKLRLKRVKGSGGKDGAQVKRLEIVLDIPLVKVLCDELNPAIVRLLQVAGLTDGQTPREITLAELKVVCSFACTGAVFSHDNYAAGAKPLATFGTTNESLVTADLKKILVREQQVFLRISIDTFYEGSLWTMLGECGPGADLVLELRPFQAELPLVDGMAKPAPASSAAPNVTEAPEASAQVP